MIIVIIAPFHLFDGETAEKSKKSQQEDYKSENREEMLSCECQIMTVDDLSKHNPRLVHHAVSALRSCIQLKRWGFEPSLSSCFSYTLSVIDATWVKTGSFLQLCAGVSLYFAVKFSLSVSFLITRQKTNKSQ